MDMCILIPLIVGAICALLGYLLGKSSHKPVDLSVYTNKIAKLEGELKDCNANMNALKLQDSRMAAAMSAPTILFNADEAKAVFGKSVKENDLKIIEGIGPKIEGLFHSAGIKTWKELSETSVLECQKILDGGGEAYKVHRPGTWPEQAKLAYEGKWKKLLEWQDILDGGK